MVTTFRSVNNRAVANLSGAVLAGAGTWTVVDGSVFPVSNFMVTCENEIALCTSRIGNVLTVTRAQDGTAASGHPDTVSVESRVVASLFTDAYAAINAIELGTDDLTTYLKLAGRSGGQTAQGGTAAADNLTLESTANAVKGRVRSLDGFVAQRFLRVGALTDPVNVVDGDATVARLFVNNDSNFSFSVVASNPRWLADSTDFIDYVRASNYFSVSIGGTEGVRLAAGGVILNALYTAAGDLEYASAASTPVRLAISVPAANVRNVLGVDNGDTVPAWKTALDSTAPTTIAVSDVATSGTSLIFAHRDHLHGSPTTWTATAHNVLSAIHGDTLADTVVRGDIIFGNSTPKWARLAKGAAGSVLWGDGTDTAWTINPKIAGYGRFGSASAPTNMASGDVTVARLFVTDGALDSEARIAQLLDAYIPGTGAFNSFLVKTTVSPPALAVADEQRAAKFSIKVQPTANYAGTATGFYTEADHNAGAFNVTSMQGFFAQAIQGVAATTVASLKGARVAYRATLGATTLAVGLEILRSLSVDAGTIGTGVGLRINASDTVIPSVADIAIQSLGGTHRFVGAANFGADSDPVNATAGDVHVKRLVIGDDSALTGAARLFLNVASFVPAALHTTFEENVVWAPAGLGSSAAAFEIDAHVQPTAADRGEYWGLVSTAYMDGNSAFNLTDTVSPGLVGLEGTAVKVNGAGTVALANGIRASIRPVAGGSILKAVAVHAIPGGFGADAGTIGDSYGFYVNQKIAGTTISGIQHGLYIEALSGAGTDNVAIRTLGGTHRFVGGLNLGTDAAPVGGYILDIHGATLVTNQSTLNWRDSGGTPRVAMYLGADNESNFSVMGGAGKHFRILDQAQSASLWQITNAGVQDSGQLYGNGVMHSWQDSGAATRSVMQLSTDNYVNLFVAGGAGKKVRVLNQAGSVENFGVDQSGDINFIGWKDVTNIALPPAPAANIIREFSFAKATGAYQDTPRWLDSSGHDSGPNMRAKNAIPLPLDPVSTALTNVIPSATLGIIGMVTLKTPITVHTISYNIGTVAAGVNGVIRIAVYTESGALIINTTDSPGLVTGVQTKTLAADVYLPAGNYKVFFCMSVNETVTNPAISCFTQEGTYRAVASEDILCGTVVVTGGAAPDPHGTITSVANRTPYFKFGGAAT